MVESIEDSCALVERTAPHTLEASLEKPQASKKLHPTDKQGKISFKIENKSKISIQDSTNQRTIYYQKQKYQSQSNPKESTSQHSYLQSDIQNSQEESKWLTYKGRGRKTEKEKIIDRRRGRCSSLVTENGKIEVLSEEIDMDCILSNKKRSRQSSDNKPKKGKRPT